VSETSWIHRWKNSKPTESSSKGPRTMNPTETIVNLRKSPELRDPRHPGYREAYEKLTAAYREIYGDRVEEDNAT
jgi:hypothetical protein